MTTGGVVNDFDDMLMHVGSWGRFQILLTLMFFPFNLFMGYIYLSSILINHTPPHWCKIDELMNSSLSIEQRKHLSIPLDDNQEYSHCMMYSTNWTEVLEFKISDPRPHWDKVPCNSGWEYDFQYYHKSVSSDFDWVCDDAWKPSISQTLFSVGGVVGCIIYGYISDHYGRMPVTLISNFIAMVSGAATPFVTSYWMYAVARFISGTCYPMCFTIPYILAVEYVDKSMRTLVGNLGLALFLTISGCYQPWLMQYLGDWKYFSWALYGQMAALSVVPFVMPESSRWLQSKGHTDRALRIMRKIASINKKEVSEETYESFRRICEKQKETQNSSKKECFLDLFRHPNLRKNTILVLILYIIIQCVFDATVRNVTNMDFSIYVSFMISVALELPADLLAIVGLIYIGRRFSSILSLGLCGTSLLIAIPLSGNVIASSTCAFIGRFSATYAMNTGFQYVVEVMPTCLRGQGTAVANILAMGFQALSPIIVYSATLYEHMPFILMGALGLAGSIPGLFLPETADTYLPDTLEEAKQHGRRDKFFWIPLCGNENRYKESLQEEDIVNNDKGLVHNKTNPQDQIAY